MNININISGASDSQSIQLLTNVINCLQSEIEKFATLEGEKNDLATKYATLEGEKNDLATKYATLEGEKNDLATKYATLEGEKNDLATKYATLEGEKNDLATKYATLVSEKEVSDNQIKEFTQEKTDRLVASIKQVSMMLHSSLKSELNDEWTEYIGHIKNDIDIFLSEVKSINDITLKIVSKNGWFAKLASIYWWSVASNVRAYLPLSLQEGSGFHYSFRNLLNEMKLSGVDVTIPNGDFSNKIDSYKKDYSDDTAMQKLFPEYRPESFVLCEINYVSFNGNLGTCIGYK